MDELQGDALQNPVSGLFVPSAGDDHFEILDLPSCIAKEEASTTKSQSSTGSLKDHLWKEFKKCVFPKHGPVCVCKDSESFQAVMSTINRFECEASSQPEGQRKQISEHFLKKVMKKLQKYKSNPTVFAENFPLYVALVVRMHRRHTLYQCGDLDKFTETVITRVESLPVEKVADVLNGFLKRGDFKIMDASNKLEVSVIQNLYEACERILELSSEKRHKRIIYCWILWVTIAVRCKWDLKMESQEIAQTLWEKYVLNLKGKSSITLSKETINCIGRGLKLGVLVMLPDELQLNASGMSALLFPHDSVRPLQHIRNFMDEIKGFLRNEEQFVLSFVKTSRKHYDHFLFPKHTSTPSKKWLSDASVKHTVGGFVKEGVEFLEAVSLISMEREWNSHALKEECRRWFSLLLKAVEIKKGVESIFGIILESGKAVTVHKDCRPHIEAEIIRKTRQMFGKLDIAVFYPLYREFDIWDNHFLSAYLTRLTRTKHAELSDEHWSLLFKEVVQRSPEPRKHGFIIDYLSSEAIFYIRSSKPVRYILDLMKLDVPNLFIGPPDDTGISCGTSVPSEKFMEDLHSYIDSNELSRELLGNLDSIMSHICPQPNGFQDLILTVLQKDIVPHLQTSTMEEEQLVLRHLNTVVCNVLKSKNYCPPGSLTRKERFCWGIVATLCDQIQPKEGSYEWAESYTAIIEKIGEIYGQYCQRQHIEHGTKESIVAEQFKPDICKCPPEVQKYYLWVQQIHTFLGNWRMKFLQLTVNYDDMIDYTNRHLSIFKIAKAVCATQLIVGDQDIAKMQTTYLQHLEELNLLLLKYVPEVPRAKWCTLTSVLSMYGISIPDTIHEHMKRFIVLPDENMDCRLTLQRNPLTPNKTGKFQPPQPISLQVSEQFTLREMGKFLAEFKNFLKPIQDCVDTLIFFTLHDSYLFSVYLGHELETKDRDLNSFRQAFNGVVSVLVQLCHGDAKYSQITANGAVSLENLDIQKELTILSKSKQLGKLPGVRNTQGLGDVKNMVDLLKITTHFQEIKQVCQQYQLEGCLNDENLIRLTAIAEELVTEETRASLTPSSATDKMDTVRELLGAKGGVVTYDYEYLAIFSKIADSAEFYQFICEKGFTGENGQACFHQQYQLITAQLQHEEYDEAVLNLLYAAYKLILPFTVKTQSFHSLLESVKQLLTATGDTVKTTRDCLMQIETVNRNITLIQLWFARAEGDTLQNVANDLKGIFQTGHFSFIIPENIADPGNVELRYTPASKRAAKVLGVEKHSLAPEEEVSFKEEMWDSEQTGAFARMLGFLDSEKGGGELVKPFLHANEVANKLLEVLLKLRELGYPSHLTDIARNGLKCNTKQADQIVKQVEHTMDEWSHSVDRLLLKHHWLLLFSLPKLLRLSKLLRCAFQTDDGAVEVMQEICFLFCNDMKSREKVLDAIKDSLSTLQRYKFDHKSEASILFRVCGIFLDALFKHSEISEYSPQKYKGEIYLTSSAHICQPTLYFTHSTEFLHSALNFSQEELIYVIVNIYKGRLPQPYEFFRCHENTTTHQLKLFITRAANHSLTFVILGVNLLRIKLQEMLLRQHMDFHSSSDHKIQPCIHYVETLPSVLQDMPWVHQVKHKLSDVASMREEVKRICHQQTIVKRRLKCVQVVYGAAGCGKSHFIKQQMKKCSCSVTVAINESFEPLKAIQRLLVLPKDERNCAIFFNFHLIPPVGDSVCKEDQKNYDALIETISWFFFDLLSLGYVEDSHSGESFQLPGGLSWSIYVEVPSRNSSSNADSFLKDFLSEIPIFKLLGTPKLVESTAQYSDVSDPDVQLVCKYLRAYEIGGKKGIDRLYKDKKKSCEVKFSTEDDLPSEECKRLLMKYMPPSVKKTKTSQLLFLRYMRRRCWFLDNLPAYNYNTGVGIKKESGELTDTNHLGSIILGAMLREAEQFCQPCFNEDGSDYHQLIYDVKDDGGSIGLLSTAPQKCLHLRDIGVDIPTMNELYRREFLDKCISRALNVPLQDGRLIAIDEENYVLTLDFTIKMLQIHERYECGEPIILQGETGVGKTSLLQMLSKLWNVSLDMELKRLKERMLEFLQNKLKRGSISFAKDQYETWLQAINSLISGVKKSVEEEDLMFIATLPFANSSGYMYQEMKVYLKRIIGDPILSLLKTSSQKQKSLEILFKEALAHPQHPADSGFEQHAKPVVKVFYALLTATVKTTFHKLNVHAAMKPDDLWKELKCVFEQAHQLQKANAETSATFLRVPHVTIFFDELNASSCGGLFKEFIVDRTFQGEPIPKNLFIVAACNPHRGNSLAALTVANASKFRIINDNSDETWIMDSYYVRQLHPTLTDLMWDYGSLGEDQEGQYVQAKVNMFTNQLSKLKISRKDQHSETQKPKWVQPSETQKQEKYQSSEIHEPKSDQLSETKKPKGNQFFIIHNSILSEMIVFSQNLMRKYAFEELRSNLTEDEAKMSSRCCVSQRDIQRVFTFYEWTMKVYQKFNPHNDSDDSTSSSRAILVALGIVYYMRLNRTYRARYQNEFALKFNNLIQFSEVFQSELDWYTQQIELPKGIAKTQALKENLFAVIICTVTQTPLIIVGAPGSSKTLSVNIVVSNLRGQESKNKIFRETDIFCCLDPHFYQCSHHTTSNEVHTVFSRAITRQKNIGQFSLPIKCVVFMDEAGLPEHSHESLKILHHHLDNPEVSFVAISNTVLDASKTNRAITLFRDPTEISEDLEVLATECLFESPGCPPRNLKVYFGTVVDLSTAYTETITKLKLARFFGLRDFIHFVQYIQHKCVQSTSADLELKEVGQFVTESLERNFSGSQRFSEICETFLHQMNLSTSDVKRRDTLKVLKDSLKDKPTIQDELRYKIIIHSSDDDSLVRLLFQYKALERHWSGAGKMRVYMCSHFPGDNELQKIDTIAGIRHSAIQGHRIVMIQTDDIHESFYDLFNRRFKRIDIPVPDDQPNPEPHDSKLGDSKPNDQPHNLKLKLQQHDSKPDDQIDKSSTRLYANIAIGAHLKPCRVHPNFKCIVALKKSELNHTPAPFLNRFEKYYLTHEDIYGCVLKRLPTGLKSVVEAAYEKVQEFILCSGGPSSFYGFCEETLYSLLLKVLPVEFKPTHTDACKETSSSVDKFENAQEKQIHILQVLTEVLTVKFNFRLTQVSTKEMECDAEYLASLVQSSNPKFERIIKTELNDKATARQAVLCAFNTLQRAPIDLTQPLAPVTQLIWSLLVQWLVRYLCKEVMQLMTPEALVLHERQIPALYIRNYLTYQKHFSLKDLIQQQLDKIAVQGKRSNTKLLCFTRTSPLIHNLPSVYSSTVNSASQDANDETWPRKHIFCDVSKLVVCKIEATQSQQSVRKRLKDFLLSEEKVLLLLASVQEVSRNTVNHLRVMIEEEEASAKEPFKPKLFVVLLHFPPTMFFISCYPSLFLNGWDHCYLDTIAHGHSHGIVDSVEWFRITCFPTEQNLSSIKDSFFFILKDLLRQSIPHVVSRLSFGSDHSRPFNQKMTPSARSEMLQRLFDTEIGDALCHHFRSYWKAEVMTEYLHRAVKFTQTGQTALNITDSIHSLMKSHFLHFVLYMINYMNDNYNLDIFFSPQSTDKVKQLFLDLTKCLPIPQKLSKLKILSSIQHGSHCRKELTGDYQLTFPYFAVVCPQIMDLVKEVAHDICQSEDSNITEVRVGYQPGFEELKKHLEERLTKNKEQEGCVTVAVAAIDQHKQFWNRYFHDFTREQLSIWSHNQQVVEEIVEAAFGAVLTPSASNISQLTSLHVYAYLNQSNILKTVAVVDPLIKLPSVTEQILGRCRSSSTSSAILLKTEDMTTFVMNTFFASLLTACGNDQTSTIKMELWYNAYHVMIHSPAIRKDIYSALSATSEAKLNVMHAAFLAVQYDLNDNDVLMKCQLMVNGLCSEHFNRHSFELQGSCPEMPEISEAITEVFGHAERTNVSIVPFIADGLLTHFFCYFHKPNKVNVLWLLEHINEQKHWLKNLQLLLDYDEVQSTLLSYHSDPLHLPLNVLKFYLLRILDSCKKESMRQLVAPYEPEGRAVLGTFLSQKIASNFTGTYIPPFYWLSERTIFKDDLHSQPLAYLYFLTVFESLLNQQNDLSVLLNAALEIYETGTDEMKEMKDKILLCIEKQALVQTIIRELAEQLVESNYKLAPLQETLNALIDEQTSGGRMEVHGDILAMHMLKGTQSLETFTRLITEQYRTHCSDYKCLRDFHERIYLKEKYSSRTNFYHLLQQENQASQVGKLHQQVCKLVTEIVERRAKPNRLTDIAKKSESVQVSLPGATESSYRMEKLSCVRMIIWLAVYHLLYNQQRLSTEMTDACSKLPPKLFDIPLCRLLCWFASPKDPPTPGHLSKLFGSSRTDPTDICLRHSLANLVACAIGTCNSAKISHLWFLVFAPERLKGTYFAGSMDGGPVNAEEGKPYEEGVKLTLDEDKLRSFLQHQTRSGLSLNSRCMLLWINVASFCVSLLTRDRVTLSGILSSTVSMEKYCVSQLRYIWKFMRTNMQLTDEELSYLMMMCMRRNLQAWMEFPDKMSGKFKSAEMVAEYEQCWHSNVFVPCLEKLRTEFIQELQDPLQSLLVEIRQLESHYPHFPVYASALYSVLSLPDMQTQSQDKLVVLSKFLCKMPELQTTLPLLPDFMEFYQWLHKDLAGVLTPEKADKISIKRLVDQMSSHYSSEICRKLIRLYQRVKCGYNQYMKNGSTAAREFDEICVRSLLTLDASKLAGNSEGDILYSIIYEMVNCHNDLLECVQTVSSHSKNAHLNRYIPGSIPSVVPTGVTENTCIVGRSEVDKVQSKFLELVSRRHQTFMTTQNQSHHVVTNRHLLTLDDLLKLQEDVVSLYLSGRPKIRNIASLHIPYAFRASKPTSKAHPLNFAQDLNQVGKCLPPTLKSNMTENHQVLQLLECEFHSADYHAMLDVVTGLKTVVALLEKRVQKADSDETGIIHRLSLKAFLCSEEDEDQTIEIFGKRLSERQISTVMNLPVSTLYHTFTTFIQWVVEGRYDFRMLPYVLKAHLNTADMEQIKKMRVLYKKGSEPTELLMELKLLTEVLEHLESSLTGLGTQVRFVDYLKPMFVFEGHDEFLGLIPRTILIKHYVSLRILLKQLAAETQKDLPKPEGEMEKPWCELVHSFAGTTAEVYKSIGNIHADYGFKHGHENESDTESDTENIKLETFSSVTQFDVAHEDELDELHSLQAEKEREHYVSSPVDETPVDALQQAHQLTPTETKQETDNHSASLLSHEMSVDTLQQVHLLMESKTKPEGDHHCAKPLVHETSMDSLQETHLLTSTEAKPETNEKQLLQLARQYSSEAVANFVTSIGYPDYAELFEDNDYSGDVLVECEDEDLKDLGIESALARLKIIMLFRRQLQGLHSVAKNFPADKVVEFLDGLKPQEKEQYKQSFSTNEIDGEMLLAMKGNYDVMIELGVERAHGRMIWSKFETLLDSQGYST